METCKSTLFCWRTTFWMSLAWWLGRRRRRDLWASGRVRGCHNRVSSLWDDSPSCFLYALSVRVSSDCAPPCRNLSSGWCHPQPSRHSCLAHAPPSGSPEEQQQCQALTQRNNYHMLHYYCYYYLVLLLLAVVVVVVVSRTSAERMISNLLLYLHSPDLCPIMWSGCASSHFHLSGPRLQDCTASPSSQTPVAYPRGGLPAYVEKTGTGCRHSRVVWVEGPAVPLALSFCCLLLE